MLGFMKRQMKREHIKLMFQNSHATNYLHAYFDTEETRRVRELTELITQNWNPSELLSDEDLDVMLATNRLLRRLYDSTPSKFSKSFDDEFQPLLGWKATYRRYGL